MPVGGLATRALGLIVVSLICSSQTLAREEVPLDSDWRFALQPAGSGFSAAAFDDRGWSVVSVPHTWNAVDGASGGSYVRGDGWYRRHFTADPQWSGRRVYVDFRAANRVAEVWVNGVRVGEHRGGYSRFRFDVTDLLRPAENVLAVRVNNEANGIIPLGGDFTIWGGLTREVGLLVVSPAHLALDDHGSLGVYLTPLKIEAGRADVQVRALVSGVAGDACDIRVVVRDARGAFVAQAIHPFRAESAGDTEIVQTVDVPNPRLWQGRSDPYLYRVMVELRQAGRAVDAVEQPLGLRTFLVDPQRGLFLNGRHVAVHGVNRHEDWLDHGMALSPEERRVDFGFLEDLGATAVRMCHYEHDDYDYQLCDSDGILAWAEVAFVGDAPKTRDGEDNAVEQLRELIRQNYNHPAIFCWSVGNETNDGADSLIARLAEVAKQEDPGRLTTYASDHKDEDPRNFPTDLLGYNRYFGWYGGSYGDLGRWLDAWHGRHPGRPLALSEYGAGASIYEHEQDPPARTHSQAKGPWHPEEWQDELHEQAWLTLQDRPYIWGSFAWCLFDFGSAGRHEGDAAGRNDKGLVTYDRRTKKDAYFWYKANWTDTPFVYITSRRDAVRFTDLASVKVYSNCESVELRLNGDSQGVRQSNDHRFVWDPLKLRPGPNRLYVLGRSGAREVSDACGWTLAAGTPYRPGPDPTAAAGR